MKTTAYKITSSLIRLFRKKPRLYLSDLTDLTPPLVFIANHVRLSGPIMMDTYFPLPYRPWIIDQMLVKEKIIDYVAETFFKGRLNLQNEISLTFASILAPLIENVMNSTNPIPVYQKHHRIKETFSMSLEALKKKQNLLIFPEKKGFQHPDFHHVFEFNTGFIHLAKQYFQECQKRLCFLPVAINPDINTIAVGKAIQYNPSNAYEKEKARICHALMAEIEKYFYPLQGYYASLK